MVLSSPSHPGHYPDGYNHLAVKSTVLYPLAKTDHVILLLRERRSEVYEVFGCIS